MQARQTFVGETAPEVMHAPPTKQPLVTGFTQTLLPSSQASAVQESPSLHERVVPVQVPIPLHVSTCVQKSPSSQLVPIARGE